MHTYRVQEQATTPPQGLKASTAHLCCPVTWTHEGMSGQRKEGSYFLAARLHWEDA